MTRSVALFVGLLVYAIAAFAEVMDKEISLGVVILATASDSIVNYLGARRRSILMLFVYWAVFGVLLGAHYSELMDPHVGPAIAREAGVFYLIASWSAPLVVVAFGLGGWLRRKVPDGA
jgi:hypothetical protein